MLPSRFMPKLHITENRHIDIEYIADIHYRPSGQMGIAYYRPTDETDPPGSGPVATSHDPGPTFPSYITIVLKNGNTIQESSDTADRIWSEYQKYAAGHDPTTT